MHVFIFYQGATFVLVNFSQKGPCKKFYVVNLGFWPTWDFKIITKIFTGPQRKVPQVAYASYIFLAKFSKRPAVRDIISPKIESSIHIERNTRVF